MSSGSREVYFSRQYIDYLGEKLMDTPYALECVVSLFYLYPPNDMIQEDGTHESG